MLKKHLGKILSGALLGLSSAVIIFIIARFVAADLFSNYEAKTYDWRMQRKIADRHTIEEIMIVDIDQRSITNLGKYSQWPRAHHANVVKFLKEAGALTIGLDILYDRDTYRPHQDVEFVRNVHEAGNVYTALYFAMADSENFLPVMNEEPKGFEAKRFYYELPISRTSNFRREQRFENEFLELLNAGAGCGHVNFNADADGVVRGIHLFTNFNNHLYPSLAFKMFMDMIGVDSLSFTDKNQLSLHSAGQTLSEIPVDAYGNMLISYEGPFKTFRYLSFYDVLNHQERNLDSAFFQNKIVFVGTSLPGLFDLRSVPLMQAFPGVEIHANILHTLLRQNFIRRMDNASTLLLMAILGMTMGILLSYTSAALSIILIVVVGVGHVIVSSMLFFESNLWVEIVTPLLTVFFTFTAVYMYRYLTEERNKRFIRSAFSYFVTKSVVDELLANPEKIKLGGEKKLCTVLFSDVQGFTTIAEQLDPQELVALLNEYLTAMTNIVFKYHGMLDKYEGDAIMAVFGAPIDHGNHAFNACSTALEMQEELARMRLVWRDQGKPDMITRVGINTGMMVVGNMGSAERFDYTVMGDAVNLGARLEPANKEYNTLIMIGEQTYKQAGELIIVRPLDLLQVKGKTEPARVYELLGTAEKGIPDEMQRVIDLYQKGFENYLKQSWDYAINYFQQALSIRPEDGPSKRYIQRCEIFRQNSPGEGWDGIWRMTTK
jgi:adenylate cyclase